jgi:protein TonB
MTTNSTQGVYFRTPAGETAMNQGSAVLSVTQRKLLSLIDGRTPLDQLTYDSMFEVQRVERDLARLIELGLVASNTPSAARPRAGKAQPTLAAFHHEVEEAPRSRAAMLAGIAAVALALAGGGGWFFLNSNSSSSSAVQAATAATAPATGLRPVSAEQPFVYTQVKVGGDDPVTGPVAIPAPRAMNLPAEPAKPEPPKPAAAPVKNAEPPARAVASPQSAAASGTAGAVSQPARQAATPAPVTAAAAAPAQQPGAGNTGAARAQQVQAFAAPAAPDASASRPAAATPPLNVASAAPTAAPETARPQPARSMLTPISKVAPDFPREAIHDGIEKGVVKARLTIDKDGNVSRVEIVEANPRRVFDKAVQRALAQWKFAPGDAGRTAETEVAFNMSQ